MKAKKFIAILTSVIIVLSLTVPTFANQESPQEFLQGQTTAMVFHDFETGETHALAMRDGDTSAREVPTPRSMLSRTPSHVEYVEYGSAPSGSFFNTPGLDSRIAPTTSQVTNTRTHPYGSVVQIITTWPNGFRTVGSGFLWRNNTVVTAAHTLFSHQHGGWGFIEVNAARDGSFFPFPTLSPTRGAISMEFWQRGEAQHDFGFIVLNGSIPGSPLNIQSLADSQMTNLSVRAVGYPATAHPQNTMWRSTGFVVQPSLNSFTSSHFGTGGLSGGPVINNFTGQVVGIHVGSSPHGSFAKRITIPVVNFLLINA